MKKKQKISKKFLTNLSLENQQQREKTPPILAIDFGEKFCGIAFSPDGAVIFPLGIFATAEIFLKIKNFLKTKKIEKIIVGLPDCGEKIRAKIFQFAKNLQIFGKKIEFENERFSSKIAGKIAARNDDVAAAKILEFFLSRKNLTEK